MDTDQYKKNLDFFREVMQIEINSGVRFFNYNLEDIADEKQKKFLQKAYANSSYKYNALLWAYSLNNLEKEHLKVLLQLYTSESFRYFFRRLEEGENNDDGQRMTFRLTMINEETKEETTLIDGTEDSTLDNNFQEWILENCSNLKAE
jgi:hypothetical protein